MKAVGTPENPPRFVQLDQRDYDRIRDRLLDLEEALREMKNAQSDLRSQLIGILETNRNHTTSILDLQRQFTLFMQGAKERFNVLSLLLAKFETDVARKDVG